jgi:hypothetical protein
MAIDTSTPQWTWLRPGEGERSRVVGVGEQHDKGTRPEGERLAMSTRAVGVAARISSS